MSKFKKNLKSMSAEQVTEKLGDWCEEYGANLTDNDIGTLRTLFNAATLVVGGHYLALSSVAAEKNGVETKDKGSDDILAAVASAAGARGQSAAKIRDYVELVRESQKAADDMGYKETRNPLKKIKIAVKASKMLG